MLTQILTSSTKRFIRYVDLSLQHQAIKEEILKAISQVIDSGIFILGETVEAFEKNFSQYCDCKQAIGVNSGTDALILVLRALGIGSGDEVITVPNSFIASTSCIEIVGAKPIFVDVKDDYTLNPNELPKALTKNTKAILPVHLTGKPADMDPILTFAKKHSLYVIEDAAQAVGALYKGKKVGTFGIAGCFSFHPLKNLNACGDGGIITTDSLALAKELRILRNLGLKSRNECIHWSSNSRLDAMQAAILSVKLKYLEEIIEKRRKHAQQYKKELSSQKNIQLPQENNYERAVYHTFIIQAKHRDALKNYLEEQGIETAIHYPLPIHQHPVFHSEAPLSFPKTENQAKTMLSLPIHQDLSSEDIEYICQKIHQFYKNLGI